jgi:hypothetical protein
MLNVVLKTEVDIAQSYDDNREIFIFWQVGFPKKNNKLQRPMLIGISISRKKV